MKVRMGNMLPTEVPGTERRKVLSLIFNSAACVYIDEFLGQQVPETRRICRF